ncbi:MAG: hypothetical protein FJ147_24665 [Deltaproteobacteria bacterium]|nr:hypothetical protein [Deltaproteobacteria bacterium]
MRQSLGSQVAMLITVSAMFLCLPTRSWSQTTEPPAIVRIAPNLVHIEPGKVPHVVAMTVKIVDPADHFVVDLHTKGEPVQWLPHTAKVDGYYRYEVWVTWQEPTGSPAPLPTEKGEQSGRRSGRVWGGFTVQGGVITPPEDEPYSALELPTIAQVQQTLTQLGQAVLDWLVPTAQAADLTASSASPQLLFDDTDLANIEWQIFADSPNATTQRWRLSDIKNFSFVLDFTSTGGNADKSIVVDANGDMSLVNGSVFIDRSTGRVGIGTTTPGTRLQVLGGPSSTGLVDIGTQAGGNQLLDVISPVPEIGFVDTDDNSEFGLQYNNGFLAFEGPGAGLDNEVDIVSISGAAPGNSLFINGTGQVGLGTDVPGGNLHMFGLATADVFNAIGPDPSANGTAFNFGYSAASFGLGSGFFNVRPAPGSLAPNPSLRFATANVQRMIIDNQGNVGIGIPGLQPQPLDRLHVNGNIRITNGSFIDDGTQLTVPDYVFAPDYKLRLLSELAVYIKQEQHLPEIPSAAMIKQQGVNLSEM